MSTNNELRAQVYELRESKRKRELLDLNLYLFIVSNITSGVNHVYTYDERVMGKDCDALCALRFLHHFAKYKKARESGNKMEDVLFLVLDNCVGQNKSQGVLMFFNLLSMLFYPKVVLHFLKKGHSKKATRCDLSLFVKI
jgi:hypothetical protein